MPKIGDYDNEKDWMSACVPKMMQDKGMENDQAVAACMNMWRERDKESKSVNHMKSDFSFTELSADTLVEPLGLKYIDGLAAGTFLSMSGEEVTFGAEELQAYIANTQKIIESTRTESGEIVGLPIDKDKHDHAGGAGWIVGLELDSARKVIRFLVNWTNEGIDLIRGNIRRFFSPSTDPDQKVILGGSLTNWPATRLETGQILLRPVELSQTIKEIDMPKTLEEMFTDLKAGILEAVGRTPAEHQADPPAEPTELSNIVNPAIKSLYQDAQQVDELDTNVQEMVRQQINLEMRKKHTKEFVADLIGGTKTQPYGFAVKSKDLIAWMLSLTDAQARFAEKILNDMKSKSIDFAQHGFDGDGFIQKPELPKEVKGYLKTWVEAGKSIPEFFQINLELGNPEDYNLSEFVKKEA